ncbi:MAG: MerR family transcriptional regulator [Myxococcota bacterium]
MKSEHTLDTADLDTSGERGLYPMRLVSRMTGLTAATIRAWERRYGAIEPARTEGNTRLFAAADVRRLALLREATERGHSIGIAARLDDDALNQLLARPTADDASLPALQPEPSHATHGPLCDAYLDAIDQYEARRGHELLHRAAALLPGRELVMEVVLPIIRAVGKRWEAGSFSVGQEHLVSSQLSALLGALRQLAPSDRGAPRVIVAAPSGHRHEFGLLVGALLAASRGLEPVYLGADLPVSDIERAASKSRATLVIVAVVRDVEPAELPALASSLQALATRHRTWVGCPLGHDLIPAAPAARYFHDFESLDLALVHVGSAAPTG